MIVDLEYYELQLVLDAISNDIHENKKALNKLYTKKNPTDVGELQYLWDNTKSLRTIKNKIESELTRYATQRT